MINYFVDKQFKQFEILNIIIINQNRTCWSKNYIYISFKKYLKWIEVTDSLLNNLRKIWIAIHINFFGYNLYSNLVNYFHDLLIIGVNLIKFS